MGRVEPAMCSGGSLTASCTANGCHAAVPRGMQLLVLLLLLLLSMRVLLRNRPLPRTAGPQPTARHPPG